MTAGHGDQCTTRADAGAGRVETRSRTRRSLARLCSAVGALVALGACDNPALSPIVPLVERPLGDSAAWSNPTPTGPAVLLAAGDIARCGGVGDDSTAALLDSLSGTILALGDEAYADGTAAEFAECYDPSWGRLKGRTRPVPGNHEYRSLFATPYFDYFGDNAGPFGRGFYSFDLGGWHVLALNSNVGIYPGSPQDDWLRADLASHRSQCTLAFWHHPRFSSSEHGSTPSLTPLWQELAAAGVDVALAGHDHVYERFAPMTAAGAVDAANGIRSFVVGTGGADLYRFRDTIAPGSEFRYNAGYGVLRLTLQPGAYTWAFLPADGGPAIDQGEGRCS